MKYERLTDKGLVEKLKQHYYGDYDKTDEAYLRLAELEDKIESGISVNLPCKLGQIIYAVYDGTIHEYYAEEINVHEDGRFIFETPTLFPKRLVFGKEVFTDKSKAKARLKELQGEE